MTTIFKTLFICLSWIMPRLEQLFSLTCYLASSGSGRIECLIDLKTEYEDSIDILFALVVYLLTPCVKINGKGYKFSPDSPADLQFNAKLSKEFSHCRETGLYELSNRIMIFQNLCSSFFV